MSLAKERLIIALDDLDRESALRIIEKTKDFASTFKIGLSLFCRYGPEIIKEIRRLGVEVFLDLKLHDIPMQVAKTLESLLVLEPRLVTIHALGGFAMLREAAAVTKGSSTKLLAVTILTSLDEEDANALGFLGTIAQGVDRLTNVSYQAGIRGFVCSPHEAHHVKTFLPDSFIVCPGIRSLSDTLSDQARTKTAFSAIKAGADSLVIGRPITKALDVAQAAGALHREITSALVHETV